MKKLLLCVLFASACGGDEGEELFTPKPECMGAAITPYQGAHTQVISKLAIGSVEDGFDLNGDGKPDNKLAAVSSLAQSAIDDSFKNYDILIPIEFFDFDTVAKDACVKFAIYLADYVVDKDGDGKNNYTDDGECNDNVAGVREGMPETNDGFDNDCDGLADENDQNQPNTTDNMDRDQDGQSVAQGDCDDNNAMVEKGTPEICHDGLDNDCDGLADHTKSATGSTACTPYTETTDLTLDPLSFSGTEPVIAFDSGAVDANMKLVAGPSIFSVNIPVTDGITLDLRITGATIEATILPDGTTMTGRLGGVIDAKTADTIRGLDVDQIGLKPENSLLDATFANLLGPLLALPKASATITKKYAGCRTPDIDVDGDGLEAFCDSNPNDEIKAVDVCIDGDGTEVKDSAGTECSTAMKGTKPRFVDGISVEMNFSTTKIRSIKPPM